jgi:hypothetical protein
LVKKIYTVAQSQKAGKIVSASLLL